MINDFVLAYKNNNKLYEYDNFLFEYLDEYNELEDKDLDEEYLKLLKNKYIIYNTSYGDIILYYSFDNSSFNYYAKSSNLIPFNYIDVVSRIYVCEYDCKKIYIDNYDNTLKDEDEDEDEDESDQDKDKKNVVLFILVLILKLNLLKNLILKIIFLINISMKELLMNLKKNIKILLLLNLIVKLI